MSLRLKSVAIRTRVNILWRWLMGLNHATIIIIILTALCVVISCAWVGRTCRVWVALNLRSTGCNGGVWWRGVGAFSAGVSSSDPAVIIFSAVFFLGFCWKYYLVIYTVCAAVRRCIL